MKQRLVAVFLWAACALLLGAESVADSLIHDAVALAREQRFAEAKKILERGRDEFPRDKRFRVELAGLAYRQHNLAIAKRELHKALQLDRKDAYANDFLGTLYFEDDNLPAALVYWNRIGKPVLNGIAFVPPAPIRPLLRERALPLSAGQVFSDEMLRQTDANLTRLDVFSTVTYRLTPVSGDRFQLTVEDMPATSALPTWWGPSLPWLRELPYQGIAPEFLNLGGKADNVRTLLRWDPNKRRATVSYSSPWRQYPRFEEQFFVDVRDEIWDIPPNAGRFRLLREEASGKVAMGLSAKLQWTVGGTVTERTYSGAPPNPLFRNGVTATVDDRFDYLLWKNPERRVEAHAFALLDAGRFFASASSRIVTIRGGVEISWRPGERARTWNVKEHAETGNTFGTVPVDQQFALSMERDNDPDLWLRGYAGTLNGRKGLGPIGLSYAISQTDLRRRLFDLPLLNVEAGPFFDSGSMRDAIGPRGLLADTGMEADVRTFGGMQVRFVYGHPLGAGGGVFYTAVYPLAVRQPRTLR